jgi:hypothetical protein
VVSPVGSGPLRINAPALAAARYAAAADGPGFPRMDIPAARAPAGVHPMGAGEDLAAEVAGASRAPAPTLPPATPPGDDYLTRLVKLVPSEIMALYLTFKEMAAAFLGVWALICLGLLIFVRAGERGKKENRYRKSPFLSLPSHSFFGCMPRADVSPGSRSRIFQGWFRWRSASGRS